MLTHLVKCCAQFGLAIKVGRWPIWLSLIGRSGVGKTHCARRFQEWASHHMKCNLPHWPQLILWPEMMDRLKGTNKEHSYDKFAEMRHWPFLVLDDVFADRDQSGFATERLLNLLSSREGKWTIITSNAGMGEIARIEPRLASRMVRNGNIVCEVNTVDFALRNR